MELFDNNVAIHLTDTGRVPSLCLRLSGVAAAKMYVCHELVAWCTKVSTKSLACQKTELNRYAGGHSNGII